MLVAPTRYLSFERDEQADLFDKRFSDLQSSCGSSRLFFDVAGGPSAPFPRECGSLEPLTSPRQLLTEAADR
jgi:hypothetical protein